MSRKLAAYFSASGVTAELATILAEVTGADLYEIKPKVPYTEADLDWNDKQSRSTIEMKDITSRPAIADKSADIDNYDVVFVGFPIWWYVAPTIVNTFLESYNFAGKVIVPFATSGSSGYGKSSDMLIPSVSHLAEWKNGTLLNGQPSKDELMSWVESLNL